jgi:hypothetical protein
VELANGEDWSGEDHRPPWPSTRQYFLHPIWYLTGRNRCAVYLGLPWSGRHLRLQLSEISEQVLASAEEGVARDRLLARNGDEHAGRARFVAKAEMIFSHGERGVLGGEKDVLRKQDVPAAPPEPAFARLQSISMPLRGAGDHRQGEPGRSGPQRSG